MALHDVRHRHRRQVLVTGDPQLFFGGNTLLWWGCKSRVGFATFRIEIHYGTYFILYGMIDESNEKSCN